MEQESEKILQNSIYSAKMLNNLVNDLLDLAKFDQNKFNFNLEFFDLI